MVEIKGYQDCFYDDVRRNLEEAGLFDSKLDKHEVLRNMVEYDPESVLVAVENNRAVGNIYMVTALGSPPFFDWL